MKLFNKGKRAYIIDRLSAVEGCRFPKDDLTKTKAYIDPGEEVEVSDEAGRKLLDMYPTELMQVDKNRVKEKTAEHTPRKRVGKQKGK